MPYASPVLGDFGSSDSTWAKSHHSFSQRQWVKGVKDVREVRLSGQDGREDRREAIPVRYPCWTTVSWSRDVSRGLSCRRKGRRAVRVTGIRSHHHSIATGAAILGGIDVSSSSA